MRDYLVLRFLLQTRRWKQQMYFGLSYEPGEAIESIRNVQVIFINGCRIAEPNLKRKESWIDRMLRSFQVIGAPMKVKANQVVCRNEITTKNVNSWLVADYVEMNLIKQNFQVVIIVRGTS